MLRFAWLAARPRRYPGFTLVELLTVVLVIGVLLGVVIPLYRQAYRTSATRTAKVNLRTIALAAQAYKFKHGRYPRAYSNPNRNGAPPSNSDFVGPGRDLAAVPVGPRNVWYEWFIGDSVNNRGHFIVKANEGGENLWGGTGSTNGAAMFDLERNHYYVQNGAPLP